MRCSSLTQGTLLLTTLCAAIFTTGCPPMDARNGPATRPVWGAPTAFVPIENSARAPATHPTTAPSEVSSSPAATLPTVNVTASDTTQPIADASGATTEPAEEGGELLADRSGMAGFGVESNRIVDSRDEVVSVLKNGATVIVKRIPSPVVAVRGYVFAGGIYEGKWLGGGLSHLLEHLVAGGSNERRTEAQNRDLLQRIGNNSNAYTTEDHTVYFINTTPPHMEDAVDLVTGWMLGASITPEEYRREYQVVQRELEMGKGEPDRQLYYLATANRYHVSPVRVPVIGYQPVIQSISRNDVYSYYKMAYQPNNMCFVVTGDMDVSKMLAAVQKNLAGAKPGRVFSHDIEQEPAVLSPRTQVATFPKLGQAKVLLGFPSVRLDHPDVYALDLLAQAMGGGESSLLSEEVRDKQQLVSGIGANDETPAYDAGTFAVEMQVDPDKVRSATDAVMSLLEQVKKTGVSDAALQRAKTELRAARVRRLETAEEMAASLADDYMSTGDAHFSDRYLQKIDQLTVDDVKRVAQKYLNPGVLLTTAIFPAEYAGAAGLPKVEELIRPATTQPTSQPATQPGGEVTRVELNNGTTVLLKRTIGSPTVSIQLFSLGGLTAENASNNGISNFAMQLLLRGTKTRDAQEIAHFFSSTGGDMTATTGNNSWYWTATCLAPAFEKTMEVYADVVRNPAFADKEVAAMKPRIVAEIQGEDADWTAQAFRYFKKEFYGPANSPYQFSVPGTEANVQGFTAQATRDWYTQHILGHGKRVLAIYGDIDEANASRLAKVLFDGARSNEAASTAPAQAPTTAAIVGPTTPALAPGAIASVNVQRLAVQKTDQELAGIVIGFDARNVIGDPGQYTLTVGQTIAGGYAYPTGYLFETLRGRGLVYVVAAENFPGRNKAMPGAFLVYAGCDPSKVNEVVDAILENIAREQGSAADINATWLERAKGLIVLADAMDHETPQQQAMTAALDELYGLGYQYHEQFAGKISAVTLTDVQAAARTRLRNCVVTISTPRPELVKTQTGVVQYKSFPTVDLTPRGVQHDVGGQKN